MMATTHNLMDASVPGPSTSDMEDNINNLYTSGTIIDVPLDELKTDDINLATLCRICATANEYIIPLFHEEGVENKLVDKIHEHLPIKVDARDSLPNHVCYQCASTLLAWHDMVQSCMQADTTLHSYLAQGHTRGVAKRKYISDDSTKSAKTIIEFLKQNKANEYIKMLVAAQNSDVKPQHTPETTRDVSSKKESEEPVVVEVKYERSEQGDDTKYDDDDDINFMDDSDSEDDEKPLKDLQMSKENQTPKPNTKKKEKSKRIRCEFCNNPFSSAASLQNHKDEMHPGFVRCRVCYRAFTNDTYLQRHIASSHSEMPPKTSVTRKPKSKSRSSKGGGNRMLTCKLCDLSFVGEDQLIDHVTLSHEEQLGPRKRGRPSKKDRVTKTLKLKNLLETMDIKTEIEDTNDESMNNNSCEASDMTALPVVEIEVALGMDLFQQEKDFCARPSICKICNKAFSRLVYLKEHLLEHCSIASLLSVDSKHLLELLVDHDRLIEVDDIAPQTLASIISEDLRGDNLDRYIGEIKIDLDEQIYGDAELLGANAFHCKKDKMSLARLKKALQGKDKSKYHKCALCDQSFTKTNHIIRHMSVHNYDYPFKCETCNKLYPNAEILAKHKRMQCENLTKAYQCAACYMKFTYEMSLNKHIVKYHKGEPAEPGLLQPALREKPHKCSKCPKSFARKDKLDIHARIHDPREKKFECPVCQKKFNRKDNLRSHTRIHDPNREEPESNCLCVYCGRAFTSSSNLIVHMRRHTGEKPFKCQICGKGFPRSSDLSCHKRTHTGEKPCLCTICGKGFSRNNKLVRHMRIHTGHRPYKCTFCDRSFTQSNDLTLHVRRHTGDKPYVCGICGDRFIQGTALQAHRRLQGHYEVGNQPIPFALESMNNPSREHGANRVERINVDMKAEELIGVRPVLLRTPTQ